MLKSEQGECQYSPSRGSIFKILEVSDDSQFSEGNIPLLAEPSGEYILRAYKTGKPDIVGSKVTLNDKYYICNN